MRVEVKVPQLPESVAEATLVSWHKQPGEAVRRDENLIDVETDKVVLELPAPAAGVLVEIRKANGTTVAGQEVIAVIDSAATATLAAPAAAPTPVATAASASASPAARVPASPEKPHGLDYLPDLSKLHCLPCPCPTLGVEIDKTTV